MRCPDGLKGLARSRRFRWEEAGKLQRRVAGKGMMGVHCGFCRLAGGQSRSVSLRMGHAGSDRGVRGLAGMRAGMPRDMGRDADRDTGLG